MKYPETMMNREELKAVFRFLPIPVIVLKHSGSSYVIMEVNEGFCKLLGKDREELLELSFEEIFPSHFEDACEELQKFLGTVERTGRKYVLEKLRCDFTNADSKKPDEMYWNIELAPLSRKSEGSRYVISFLDISAQVLVQKEKEDGEISQRLEHELLVKFRALVKEGSDLMSIIDEEGNYLFKLGQEQSVLGMPSEEFIGRNVFDFIHPEDRPRMSDFLKQLQKKDRLRIPPFRFKTLEGDWKWLESSAINLNHDPAVGGIVINSRDVTTLMEQAREIEEVNQRYRLAATASHDLIYDWDLENDEVTRFYGNREHLFGYKIAEVDARDFWRKHIHPDERHRLRDQESKTLRTSDEHFYTTKYRFRRADGSYAHLVDRAYIIRNGRGKPVRLVGAVNDVSDAIAKEEALQQANERFTLAMEVSNEMIWDWDIRSGKIMRNRGFERIFGYDAKKSYPTNTFWFSKVHPEDRSRAKSSLLEAVEDGQQRTWRQEYRIFRANGELAYVIDRCHLLRNSKGEATRAVGAVLDVTGSRKLIAEIQQQNEVLREIAWEQSHVVRAPLARIKGLVKFLETGDFEENSKEKVLDHIVASTNELDKIIRRIVRKSERLEGRDEVEWEESFRKQDFS